MAPYTVRISGYAGNSTAGSGAGSGYGNAQTAGDNNYCYGTAGNTLTYSAECVIYPAVYVAPEPETEEQRQQRQQREREWQQDREMRREQQRERQRQVLKAAEDLLRECIGLEAFGKLHEVGYIEVDSQKYKGRKYRVPNGSGRIEVLDEQGKVIDRLCVVPEVPCPMPDQTLARIVLLETNEEYVLAKANHELCGAVI